MVNLAGHCFSFSQRMREFFDVCILGGGPAGSAAALALKKHSPETSILLIESSDYSQWRVGESLSPDAGRAFRELDVWQSFLEEKHLHSQGSAAAWESAYVEQNEFIFHPEGKGWHLNRVDFDRWMAGQAAAKGAELRKRTRYVTHERTEKCFLISLEGEEGQYQVEAGLVFDALGRMSAFGRNEKVKRVAHDRLSAVIGFYKANSSLSEISTYTLVEAVENGWWYSALLADQHFIVAYMCDSDLLKSEGLHEPGPFAELLQKTQHTQHRVEGSEPVDPLRILSAASVLSEPVCGEGWIALGDAASTFDPLSSQGIYKAIRSGMFGAYSYLDLQKAKPDPFAKYQRFIADEYREYLETRKEFYGRVNRWPASEFWKRRRV